VNEYITDVKSTEGIISANVARKRISSTQLYMTAVMTEREAEPDASGCRDKRHQRHNWRVTIGHWVGVSRQWADGGTGTNDNSQCVTGLSQHAAQWTIAVVWCGLAQLYIVNSVC